MYKLFGLIKKKEKKIPCTKLWDSKSMGLQYLYTLYAMPISRGSQSHSLSAAEARSTNYAII